MTSKPQASGLLHADVQEIARTLAALFQAGDVIEMRVPKTEREGTLMLALDSHSGERRA